MSDSIETVRRPGVAIGGIGITYQAILIDGKTLAFETAIDSTTDRADLDGLLDTVIGAAKRQQAVEELPLVRQGLHANMATLADQERGRARQVAQSGARVSAANAGRRNVKPMSDGDLAAVAQFDQRISQLKSAIAAAQARVPYLEAIIARRDPPDPFPQPKLGEDGGMAAEAA